MKEEEGKKEEKKKPRPGNQCRRLSERGSYLLQELFKTRRMSLEQIARLLGLDATKRGAMHAVYRLESMGLVRHESAPLGDRLVRLVRLSDPGARIAADSLGRAQRETYRDDVQFVAHLLQTGNLYLALVREGTKSWVEARQRATSFDWLASNEDTQFLWQAMREFDAGQKKYRRVVPDVTIETDTRRFLIEIEKSTKSLRAVDVKVAQYCAVFSPLKSAGDRPAYQQKYGDTKRAAVVFIFDSETRAANARRLFERRAREQNFMIPEWHCGTIDSMAALLRKEIFGETKAPASKPPAKSVLSAADHALLQDFFLRATAQLEAAQDAYAKSVPPPRPPSVSEFQPAFEFLKSHRPSSNG